MPIDLRYAAFPAVPIVAFSTWDPTLNPTLFTYSNGNLTALRNNVSSGNNKATRSTSSRSSGKLMFELTCVADASRVYFGFGCNVSWPLDGSALGGDTNTNSTAMLTDFNRQQYNGASISGVVFGSVVAAADVCTCAVHFGAGTGGGPLFWWRKNATGNWNGSVGADPATDTGGIDIGAFSPAITGPFFILCEPSTNGDGFTLNVGASAFTDTLPAGYAAWG